MRLWGQISFWLCSAKFPMLFELVSWPLIGQAVSSHLQTNCWPDCTQIWQMNPLWDSPGLINLWSHSNEFPFLGRWSLVEPFPLSICTLLIGLSSNLACELMMGLQRPDQAFGHAPLNSLWPSDTIRWQRTESILAQAVACCLTAPSHYLNQCWLISKVLHGIHRRALSWEDLKIPISKNWWKITFLKSHSDLPGANESIPDISWCLICGVFSVNLQTNCWFD